jgi:hypothetical protein
MKVRNVLLTTMMVGVLIGGAVQADLNFTVDSGATQFAYVNHELIGGGEAGGFGYNPDLTTSTFVGSTQVLGPNTDIYTANVGGTAGYNVFWFTGAGPNDQSRIIEALTFQETDSVLGTTVNFDYSVLANTMLANGYTGEGFIKVLDPGAGWGTVQTVTADLATLGATSLTLDVGATIGVPKIQAGFAITGLYVDPTTAAGLGTVEVIPEPATFGLIGIFGAGLLFSRRKFRS